MDVPAASTIRDNLPFSRTSRTAQRSEVVSDLVAIPRTKFAVATRPRPRRDLHSFNPGSEHNPPAALFPTRRRGMSEASGKKEQRSRSRAIVLVGTRLRVVRGGSWFSFSNQRLAASNRNFDDPTDGFSNFGFRVATVPEPSTMLLLVAGAVGIFGLRRRM